MIETYRGSCHCGAVRFECDLDLTSIQTSRCNCSICTKGRFWKTVVGANAFRLLAGEEALTSYRFGSHNIEHRFCSRCGVKPFGKGHHEALGGTFFAINLACLDDLTPEQLAELPVHFEDGQHDDWANPPPVTSYL